MMYLRGMTTSAQAVSEKLLRILEEHNNTGHTAEQLSEIFIIWTTTSLAEVKKSLALLEDVGLVVKCGGPDSVYKLTDKGKLEAKLLRHGKRKHQMESEFLSLQEAAAQSGVSVNRR